MSLRETLIAQKREDDINEILAQRRGTHGSFAENARVVEALMGVYRSAPNWGRLPDTAREVMHMIAHKQARILSGNPHEPDHWLDISGYSKLEHDECVRRTGAADAAAKATEVKHTAAEQKPLNWEDGVRALKPGEWIKVSGHGGTVLIQPYDGSIERLTCDCIAVCFEMNTKDGTDSKIPVVRYIVDRNALTLDVLERLCLHRLTDNATWKEFKDLPACYRILYERKEGAERFTIRPEFARWTTV